MRTVVSAQVSGKPDARLYIWDVEMDTIQFFNFETGLSEQDELVSQSNELESEMSAEDRCVCDVSKTNCRHVTVNVVPCL